MTPLSKWIRKRLEKALGRYEEGQDAPARLREQVVAFANGNRRATRQDWVTFAADYAEECYRSGYLRGVEWAEREPAPLGPRPSPEQIADSIDPTWRERAWRPDLVLVDPASPVPEERSPLEAMIEQAEAFAPKPRRF